jgi:hypothetical protein
MCTLKPQHIKTSNSHTQSSNWAVIRFCLEICFFLEFKDYDYKISDSPSLWSAKAAETRAPSINTATFISKRKKITNH